MSKPVRLVFKREILIRWLAFHASFSLADILKIIKFMSETWLQFFEGKIDAKAVLEKYKEKGCINGPRS